MNMKMTSVDLPIDCLREASWNPNAMERAMVGRLRESISRYGLMENLVVRSMEDGHYEVLSGNHRIRVLVDLGYTTVPCVVVTLDDAHARLLAQALNRVHGEDDIALRAELVKRVLDDLSEEDVLAVLPESADSLRALASLGQQDMAQYLENWQQAQAAKLKHVQFQLTPTQLEVVEEALNHLMPMARQSMDGSPNVRGTALYLLALEYLAETKEES